MKILSLLMIAAGAAASSLRGDFDADVVEPPTGDFEVGDFEADVVEPSSGRSLSSDCAGSASYLGCYRNRNMERALPVKIPGQDHSAAACHAECLALGMPIFAREWKGQCFCGPAGVDYGMHGPRGGCDCCGSNVGGNAMCVWMAGGTPEGCGAAPSAPYLGCFRNKNRDRALDFNVGGRFHSAQTCMSECTSRGFKYFAREWKGQCWCGDKSNYGKHGTTDGCDCCGGNVGANKMCVWGA